MPFIQILFTMIYTNSRTVYSVKQKNNGFVTIVEGLYYCKTIGDNSEGRWRVIPEPVGLNYGKKNDVNM